MNDPQKPGGVNIMELIKLMAPIIGGVAGGDPGHFMGGYLHQQNLIDEQRQQDAERQQRMKATGANFMVELGKLAQGAKSPAEFQSTMQWGRQAYTHGGYGPAEDLSGIQFNDAAMAEADKKDAQAAIDQLVKLNDPSILQSHSAVQFKGHTLTIQALQALAGGLATDLTTGEPYKPPKKADANASTDYGRFLAKFAKDKGKTVDTLTTAEELAAKDQFAQAGRAPAGGGDYTSRYLESLVGLWKEGHPGQELPMDVQRQLMLQAKKDVGQADDRAPQTGGLRDYQQFMISDKLAKEWLDISKPTREMNRQFQLMQTGLDRFNAGDKNGGSQAVLVTFQKILDPSSVVRESEYARSSAGISMLGRLQGYADRIRVGGAGVPAQDLAAMVQTARQFLQNMEGYTAGQRKRIEAQTKKWQIDPVTVFDELPTDPASSAQQKLGGR